MGFGLRLYLIYCSSTEPPGGPKQLGVVGNLKSFDVQELSYALIEENSPSKVLFLTNVR